MGEYSSSGNQISALSNRMKTAAVQCRVTGSHLGNLT